MSYVLWDGPAGAVLTLEVLIGLVTVRERLGCRVELQTLVADAIGDIGDVEWNKLGLKIDPKAAQKHHEDNYKKK